MIHLTFPDDMEGFSLHVKTVKRRAASVRTGIILYCDHKNIMITVYIGKILLKKTFYYSVSSMPFTSSTVL